MMEIRQKMALDTPTSQSKQDQPIIELDLTEEEDTNTITNITEEDLRQIPNSPSNLEIDLLLSDTETEEFNQELTKEKEQQE